MSDEGVVVAEPERSGYEQALERLAQWIQALLDGLETLSRSLLGFGTPARATSLTALAAGLLGLMGMFLGAPSGFGLEDWQGWGSDAPGTPGGALLALWNALGLRPLAQFDLDFDTAVFVPCYAGLLTRLLATLGRALWQDRGGVVPAGSGEPPALVRVIDILLAPLVALVLCDLAENLGTLLRLDGQAWWLVLVAALLCVLVPVMTGALIPLMQRWHLRVLGAGAVLAGLGIWLAGSLHASECAALPADSWGWLAGTDMGAYGCASHHAKRGFMAVLAVGLLLLGGLWLFAALRRNVGQRAQDPRAPLRAAIGDMLVRSRYVLIALAMLGLLCVAMDQARDLLYATLVGGRGHAWPERLGAILFAAFAAWTLAFSAWLWTRSICELERPGAAVVDLPWAQDFARYWARLLGMVPLLMFALLAALVCADAIHGAYAVVAMADAPPGELARSQQIAGAAFVLAAAYLLSAFAFAWSRGRQNLGSDASLYYNHRRRGGWLLGHEHYCDEACFDPRYSFAGRLRPSRLLGLALWGFFAARACDVLGDLPSLAQAEIALALAFWLGVFGWLSLQELRSAVPWVLLLVLLVGVLGLLGWDSRQIVWGPLADPSAPPGSGLDRLLASAALALLLHGACMLVFAHARDRVRAPLPYRHPLQLSKTPRPPPGLWRRVKLRWRRWLANRRILAGLLALLWAAALGAMAVADRVLTERGEQADSAMSAPVRPTLDRALADWLDALCRERADCIADAPAAAASEAAGRAPSGAQLDVYLIASAGGGIRAAAWTADVLESWEEQQPGFAAHTFAISGVSGGAVGAALFRACRQTADPRACIDRFMHADLLAPLISAWMFEDVIGHVLPSPVCREQPACGFLSRGAWFEAGMEEAAPVLRQPLAGAGGTALPHLLLDSTWVESGERAVASDLDLQQGFPGVRDQLDILRHDLPLSTAAHNAARFPYTNPIGELRAGRVDCLRRTPAPASAPRDAAGIEPDPRAELKAEPCGHLADGGYYDNSGMDVLADVMRGLRACLAGAPGMPACATLSHRAWLAQHLHVRTLMLRNTPRTSDAPLLACADTRLPTAAQVAPLPALGCRAPVYAPQTPVCADPDRLYIDALGPPLAVLMGSGIGAHGRAGEAQAFDAAAALPRADAPVAIDLLQRAVHFPLGWHLSGEAAKDIRRQALDCALQ